MSLVFAFLLNLAKRVKVVCGPQTNPYTPNPPARRRASSLGVGPEVAGLPGAVSAVDPRYTEAVHVVTGLRGVGKTVLLGEYHRIATEENWVAVETEVSKNTPFGPQMANLARRALLQVSPRARVGREGTPAAGS